MSKNVPGNTPNATPAATDKTAALALYEKQKKMLDTLLAHGAVTQKDYDRSLTGLREKMGL